MFSEKSIAKMLKVTGGVEVTLKGMRDGNRSFKFPCMPYHRYNLYHRYGSIVITAQQDNYLGCEKSKCGYGKYNSPIKSNRHDIRYFTEAEAIEYLKNRFQKANHVKEYTNYYKRVKGVVEKLDNWSASGGYFGVKRMARLIKSPEKFFQIKKAA